MRGDIGHISLIVVKESVEQVEHELQTRRAGTSKQIEGPLQKLGHCPIEKVETRRE